MTDIDMTTRESSDKTFATRLERYNYVVAKRAETPKPSLQSIADEIGISKQNVARLIKRGGVKPTGRQPSNASRKRALAARIDLWTSRRTAKLAKGLDVAYEDGWIAELESRLKLMA